MVPIPTHSVMSIFTMAQFARTVVARPRHQVAQRGNRREAISFVEGKCGDRIPITVGDTIDGE